jgi:hypothetical protein
MQQYKNRRLMKNMPDSQRYAIQEETNNIKHSDLVKNA